MSLITNNTSSYEMDNSIDVLERPQNQEQNDEMTICTKSVVRHRSPMSPEMKKLKREQLASLNDLFEEVLGQKGERDLVEITKDDNGELWLEGLSSTALHSFILKAEELGKHVTYTKITKVKISD